MSQTKRIEFIDALRGFTMILVVLNHIETQGFVNEPSIIGRILMTFRMPLFFFISGYIAYKANKVWNLSNYILDCLKKIKVQLIPTLVFGLSFAYLIDKSNIITFFTDVHKLGYWFTLTLLSMFVIYYTISIVFTKITNASIDNNKGLYAIVLIGLCGVLVIFDKLFLKIFPEQILLYNALSLSQVASYMPFFVCGIIASSYKQRFENIINNQYAITSVILMFIVITTSRILLLQYTGILTPKIELCVKLAMGINGLLGIVIVYKFFQSNQITFSQNNRLGRGLQYIGRRTLDIYVLHFFLIPDLSYLKEYMGSSSTVVGLFTCLIVALMVVAVCLVISSVLRLSPILSQYLFGVKQK